jgi:hypothetical protein
VNDANTVEDLAWCLNGLYSGQAVNQDDSENLEFCNYRLSYIGESYSVLDQVVRQDFEASLEPGQWE